MSNLPDSTPRRELTLADIRDHLQRGLSWNADLAPVFTELPQAQPTVRGVRGYLGEDQVGRTVVARGEILLDGPVGVEGWNEPGPDIVTLAENQEGLAVKFYDNKACTSRKKVSSVDALDKHFHDSLEGYKADWSKLATDPARTPAEQELFRTVLTLVDQGRYRLVVTNYYGRIEGVTDRVSRAHIEFEDMAGNLTATELPPALSALQTAEAPAAAGEATLDPAQLPPALSANDSLGPVPPSETATLTPPRQRLGPR